MHCMLVKMEITIKKEKENPFFKRKELKLKIKHPKLATPPKVELVKELSKKFSVPEEQIVIDYIFTEKGISESMVKAKILEEKPKPKLKREEKPKEKIKREETKEVEKIETQTSKTE